MKELKAIHHLIWAAEEILKLVALQPGGSQEKTERYIAATAILQQIDGLMDKDEDLESEVLERTDFSDLNVQCDEFWNRCSLTKVNLNEELRKLNS